MRGLRLRGLLSHAGHGYRAASTNELQAVARQEAEILRTLQTRAAEAGVPLDELSVGATPTLRFSAREPGLTELRPGNYVYFDRTQIVLGSATLEDCALTVLATVVSKPSNDRIILDCGSKTLSSDLAPNSTGYGVVLTADGSAVDESLTIERLSEEHATVESGWANRARTRRSRPRAAQPLLRRLEPGRRDSPGRGRSRDRRRCRWPRGDESPKASCVCPWCPPSV